jgi:hypothetical protein
VMNRLTLQHGLRGLASGRVAWLLASLTILAVIVAARSPYRNQPDALFVSDGFGYYIYLPSLFLDGDLDFDNQLARQPDQLTHPEYGIVPETGRRGNAFQVGSALLWSPFFLLAHGAVTALRAFGWEIQANGFGFAYELPVYCGSFLYGLLGLWCMKRLLSEIWNEQIGTATTLLIALGTPAAAYLWFEPDMSHILSMSLITVLVFRLHSAHQSLDTRTVTWAGIGLLLGLIMAVRAPDGAVALNVVLVGLAIASRSAPGGTIDWSAAARCTAICVATAVVAFLPQMLVWKHLYDAYLVVPRASGYERLGMNWFEPDAVGYFVGDRRGMLRWAPLWLLSIAGLIVGLWRGPAILRFGVPALLFILYFNCSIPRWWIGSSFGDRRAVDFTVFFALGLAQILALRWSSVWKRPAMVTAVCLCVFNWLLMIRYFGRDLPEQGAVSWSDFYLDTLLFPLQAVGKLL